MLFTIIERFGRIPYDAKNQFFLHWDDWNDYDYYTLFRLTYNDDSSTNIEIGSVKIAFINQKKLDRVYSIGHSFDELPQEYFSVGLDDSYYDNLNKLGSSTRDSVLIALRDIARDDDIFKIAMEQEVTHSSFLRGLSVTTITGQFRRMAFGDVRLTKYDFSFEAPKISGASSNILLTFKVRPHSKPPTNIHILIGRNGVGKTHLINNMINALYEADDDKNSFGKFNFERENNQELIFANLICVSFSAFDSTLPKAQNISPFTNIQYSYIGLQKLKDGSINEFYIKSKQEQAEDFFEGLNTCFHKSKIVKWKNAIEKLQSDEHFREANITSLGDLFIESPKLVKDKAIDLFSKLSSGHKIILLSITQLVAQTQERSFVLIDEPEAHLHPPLLSAFTRALSELLIQNNAVAIIATHSPVILQEVPNSCVWKLRRSGIEAIAERLEIETFGENVGRLTSAVFGLEVMNSGFYNILHKIVDEFESYNDALEHFDNNIGMEARSILMTLYNNKNNSVNSL
ncbi:AAA family ATPase [Parasediminibacterium paludis]|uniref:AAA family ATPase n=1 Tax=Parasediminibacterium paludis TaxID=908966 RepID=A0ABV8PXS4_9BACT